MKIPLIMIFMLLAACSPRLETNCLEVTDKLEKNKILDLTRPYIESTLEEHGFVYKLEYDLEIFNVAVKECQSYYQVTFTQKTDNDPGLIIEYEPEYLINKNTHKLIVFY